MSEKYIEKEYDFLVNILAFKAVQYIIRMSIFNKNDCLKNIINDDFFRSRVNISCIVGLNIEKKLIYIFYRLKSIIGLKITINVAHYYYKIKEKICRK